METFEIRGSQWVLSRIVKVELKINKYNPLRGSSYIPLPEILANKKAIINIKNNDNKCFLWSVLAALHPANKDPQRVTKYVQYEHDFHDALKDIEFPVKLTDVQKISKRLNISINVYGYDNKNTIVYITKEKKENILIFYYTKTIIVGSRICPGWLGVSSQKTVIRFLFVTDV
jgi:hypothetical protein